MTRTKECRALNLRPAPLVDHLMAAFCQPVRRGRTHLRLLSIGSRLSSGASFSPGLKERRPFASRALLLDQHAKGISTRRGSACEGFRHPRVVKPGQHGARKAPGKPGGLLVFVRSPQLLKSRIPAGFSSVASSFDVIGR